MGTLVERAELEREEGRLHFVDPLLEAWLRDVPPRDGNGVEDV
jgi:hypothetical protein